MYRSAWFAMSLLLVSASTMVAQEGKKQAEPASTAQLKTPRDHASYGLGRNIGDQLKSMGLNWDVKVLTQGIADALSGTKSAQTPEEFEAGIKAFEKEQLTAVLEKNKTFLATNAKQAGVTALPSGLQYQVIKAGTGKRPSAKDSVKAHYKGTFLDGKTFDSSYDRGEPAVFPLQGVIRGWTEGVPLMQEGAKYRFWIPSDLAYGERGRPGMPANSLLVFEIELIEVIADEAPAPKK